MKTKLAVAIFVMLLLPLVGLAPGCNGPDNPKIADAPPPPPPTAEDQKPHVRRLGTRRSSMALIPGTRRRWIALTSDDFNYPRSFRS